MDELLAASVPVSIEDWPEPGTISSDGVATVGYGGFVFLFQGTNRYYDYYFDTRSWANGQDWASLTASRHERFPRSGVPFLSLFVPNKASILGDAYPYWLPRPSTLAWARLKLAMSGNGSVLFAEDSTLMLDDRVLSRETYLRRVDSHWSVLGCLASLQQVLHGLGLSPLEVRLQDVDRVTWGDLSSRWGGRHLVERELLGVADNSAELGLPEPRLAFDSFEGRVQTGAVGRIVTWVNSEAQYDRHLCLVGNSYSGPGLKQTQLVWWLARLFTRVTFLHSGGVPTDILEVFAPDVLIFQGLERFLCVVPKDTFSVDELLGYPMECVRARPCGN